MDKFFIPDGCIATLLETDKIKCLRPGCVRCGACESQRTIGCYNNLNDLNAAIDSYVKNPHLSIPFVELQLFKMNSGHYNDHSILNAGIVYVNELSRDTKDRDTWVAANKSQCIAIEKYYTYYNDLECQLEHLDFTNDMFGRNILNEGLNGIWQSRENFGY
jgi:hypothetical protein